MRPNELLKEMFALQQKLNDETNGIGWENGYTKNNKLINWKRCIYMECAELVDSFAWKHWKNIDKPTDWENVRVEIVDIWHFVMSLLLENYKTNNLGDMDKLVEDVSDTLGFKDFCNEAESVDDTDSLEIVNDIETLLHMTSGFRMKLFDDLLHEYFQLSLKCGVNIHELYKYYVAKNVLNKFRQDNGYKEGNYIKNWNGKEDNVVMLEVLSSGFQSIESIYEALDEKYRAIAV